MNQIKKEVNKEFTALHLRNKELESMENEHRRLEKKLLNKTHDLEERIKEINCLYGISKLVEKNNISLEEIYQGVIELIPCSWQYPEITCAKLVMGELEFTTDNFAETPWWQSVDIVIYGVKKGVLNVYYLEEKPEIFEGPFLEEERALINAIAERLSNISGRKLAEEALNESEKKLKKKNLLLQKKNIALREVMNQLITEKKSLEERVMDNIDHLLLPLLNKIKNKGSQVDKAYFDLLEDNVKQLTSSFGSNISRKLPQLTPRENEICNMVRSGLSSKEVAKLLNISYRSVETYRNYIRKKLGITNQKVNLTTYLGTL